MQRIYFSIFFWLFLQVSYAQTDGRKLLAHYPLTEHFGDITGQEDTLETANVSLTSDGANIDGANPFGDTANQIAVILNDLDFADFYIELEVKIDSIPADGIQPTNSRNIFVGGRGWRWIQVYLNQDLGFISIRNNGIFSQSRFDYIFDTWYQIGISYDSSQQVSKLYINDQLIATDTVDLDFGRDKSLALNCICGPWNMKGNWKNLMVYGADTRTIPLSLSCAMDKLPTDDGSLDGSVLIEIEGGVPPYQISWNGGDTSFQEIGTYIIPKLGLGTYEFEIFDDINVRQTCETSLQLPDQLALIAYYPLQANLQDELMLNPDMQITNVEFKDSALYIDGSEPFTDTSNSIFIPRISKLNHTNFEIQLDFKLDSNLAEGVIQERVILLAGVGFRWASLIYQNDTKELRLSYNNGIKSNTRLPFEFDKWYEMSISYNRLERLLRLFLDGEKVDELSVDLITSTDQSIALNCCNQRPMRGYWRDLRVFSSEIIVIPDLSLNLQSTEWNGTANAEDGAMRISIIGGSSPYTAQLFSGEIKIDSQEVFGQEVTFSNLPVGSYEAIIEDRFDSIKTTGFELLPPQTDLPIMSYYPFDLSVSDTSLTHRAMTLTNVEHIFQEGLSLPGNNNSSITDVDQIFTSLPRMNQNDFYISLNVTIDSINNLVGNLRSIFILGSSTRWMYPYYSVSDQQIHLAFNNTRHPEVGGFTFEYGKEYEIAVSYDQLSRIGKIFIDRQEVIRDTFDLETGGDVSFAMNCNCGPSPMKGFWRDFRLYSVTENDTSTVSTSKYDKDSFVVFPNPGSSHVTIQSNDKSFINDSVIWYDAMGKMIKQVERRKSIYPLIIPITDLDQGIYWIKIGRRVTKFIKM